jgi:hypothetical protein
MILFNPVVQLNAGPVPDTLTQFSPDRSWVAVVAVRSHLVRVTPAAGSMARPLTGPTRCLDRRRFGSSRPRLTTSNRLTNELLLGLAHLGNDDAAIGNIRRIIIFFSIAYCASGD